MRPVNLIPPDQRRGAQAPLRTGPLAYLVVGAFAAVLVAVTVTVLIGNRIDERKVEVAQLHRDDAVAAVQAQRLASYTQFRTVAEQRVQTVGALADSRFDWERVMRELALILPHDVWLTALRASAASGAAGGAEGGGSATGLRASVAGPALELSGCGSGQEAVAGFVTDLKDIDAVTRVGVEASELPDEEDGAGVNEGGEAGGGGNEDCRTRKFITEFKLVVAFDAAPVAAIGGGEGEVAPPTEQAESTAAPEEAAPEEG